MRNPLRSEAEAFNFLIVVIGGCAVIAGCAYVNEWLGVAAAVLVVGGVGYWLVRSPSPPGARPERLESPSPPGLHRILLLAPPGTAAAAVRDALVRRADGSLTQVLVLTPALASGVEAVSGQVDERRVDAQRTADELAASLAGPGLSTRAEVGADDPLLALEDAMRRYGADEILLAGGDEALAAAARERLAVPVSRLG